MDILIQNGKAHELFQNGAPELHPSLEVVKDYKGAVEVGYVWDGNKFSVPAEPVDTRTYADKRKAEYPPFEEYLDGIVKDDQVQIQKYIAACQAVKAKYPKP